MFFFQIKYIIENSFYGYLISTSSTSKIKVEFGGITPPAPDEPYANSGGITRVAELPFFSSISPSSQPGMTWPIPKVNSIGLFLLKDESN